MDRYRGANRTAWDAWAKLHVGSPFYDVEGFKRGVSRRAPLDALETRLVGDVAGRSLLHLQCHFGLDTIAWARRGAVVTGVDFSGEAIAAARALAADLGVAAAFVESDIYDLPERLGGEFDVVFTSHGVLGWLPDLERWGGIIARFLKPGGRFCIVEQHPFAMIFDDAPGTPPLHVAYPYFHAAEPMRVEGRGSYAVPEAPVKTVTYQWAHALADILGAVLRAGLRIESFEEHAFECYRMFPWLERRPDGTWRAPSDLREIPLMFSLTAVRPER